MANFMNFLSSAVSLVLASSNGNAGAFFVLSCGSRFVNFPVSPASFDVSDSYGNASININAIGEMNMMGKRNLSTLTFSSIFPAQYYGFEQSYPIGDPYSYVDAIKAMAQAGRPSRISISGTTISILVTIDSFQYGEHDGSGDVYFSISLREYRDFATNLLTPDSVTGLKNRSTETLDTKTITIRQGQSIMDVAAACCRGDSSKRLKLYALLSKRGRLMPGTDLTVTGNKVMVNGQDLKEVG
nr:MAG TPA: tail assembly protein [Caudoviricetes sp.]